MAAYDLPQPFPLFGDWPVHPPSQLDLDILKLLAHAVATGLPLKLEMPATRFSADEREPQKSKGLRFSEPTILSIDRREATKLNQAGLVRVKRQRELLQPCAGTRKTVSTRTRTPPPSRPLSTGAMMNAVCGPQPRTSLRKSAGNQNSPGRQDQRYEGQQFRKRENKNDRRGPCTLTNSMTYRPNSSRDMSPPMAKQGVGTKQMT